MLNHYPKLKKLFNKALKKGKRDDSGLIILPDKNGKMGKELCRIVKKSFKKVDLEPIDDLIDTAIKNSPY